MGYFMKLNIIIPCYNEEEVLEESYRRFVKVMSGVSYDYSFIFINDGSRDRTLEILRNLAKQDEKVTVISFSRNFGHQNAVSAGLHNVDGDAAVIIDADLQDPPEEIPKMVEKWQTTGCNIVYAVRESRKGESFFKLMTARIYYRTLNALSEYAFPVDTGDFRLVDRAVVDAFARFPEKHKYLRGLFSWMGFRQEPHMYKREERYAGSTKYSLSKMVHLAAVGIFGFSKKPLKLAISLGLMCIIFAIAIIVWMVCLNIFRPEKIVPGWSSTIFIVLLMGGIQLFTIGILGEYIGNIFDETKGRPEYIIQEKINLK